jgi:hypothetical protein
MNYYRFNFLWMFSWKPEQRPPSADEKAFNECLKSKDHELIMVF